MVQCEKWKCSGGKNIDLFQVTPVIYKSIDEYINQDTGKTDFIKIELNGLEAVKAVIPGGPQAGGSALEVFVVHDGQGYYLHCHFDGLFDKTKLDQLPSPNPDILSTFKFLP